MADVGRPTVMTPEVIAKLEEAFLNGATDLQACFVANISKDSLYRYIKENPEFSDRKEALKDDIKYKAKMALKRSIENELISDDKRAENSKWLLERKSKDEGYNSRTEITGVDGKDLFAIDKERKEKALVLIEELIDNNEKD